MSVCCLDGCETWVLRSEKNVFMVFRAGCWQLAHVRVGEAEENCTTNTQFYLHTTHYYVINPTEDGAIAGYDEILANPYTTSIRTNEAICIQRNTEAESRNHLLPSKSSKYYTFWMCVCCLGHPARKTHAPYYIVIWDMSGCTTVCHIIS